MKQARAPTGVRAINLKGGRKMQRNTRNVKNSLLRLFMLAMMCCLIFNVFVACGGLPASTNQEEASTLNYSDPPKLNIPDVDVDPLPVPDIYLPPNISDNAPTEEDEPIVVYAASSESDKYHLPSCHYVDQILPQNLIYFYSEISARRAGYSPCSVCSP